MKKAWMKHSSERLPCSKWTLLRLWISGCNCEVSNSDPSLDEDRDLFQILTPVFLLTVYYVINFGALSIGELSR